MQNAAYEERQKPEEIRFADTTLWLRNWRGLGYIWHPLRRPRVDINLPDCKEGAYAEPKHGS